MNHNGNGADVVVVGGGPAGLAAATELKRLGIASVVLLERDTELGGIPRHCGHSPFGVREFHRIMSGERYAARLEREAREAGVAMFARHSVLSISGEEVATVSPDGPRSFGARRVLLATGVRERPRSARLISGERPVGILNTASLQSYVYLEGLVLFRRPVIVGTELVATSAILTCRSAGIRPAAVLERGERSTARFPFALLPTVLGIPRHFGAEITGIEGKKRVERVTFDLGGTTHSLDCDGIVFTGEFTPEAALARRSGLAIDEASGGPIVDTYGRTTATGVFAAGNLLRPVETAGWCWAESRRIAGAIAADLSNGLPPRSAATRIRAGQGIKLVMPQEISLGILPPSMPQLQIRLDAKVRGTLRLSSMSGTIWSRTIDSAPERRVLVPIADIALTANAGNLQLDVI